MAGSLPPEAALAGRVIIQKNRLRSVFAGTTFPGAYPGVNSGRTFDGSLDEIAFYGSALSATTISNNYFLGTNNPAGYAAQVLASSPIGYWHMDEPVYTARIPARSRSRE